MDGMLICIGALILATFVLSRGKVLRGVAWGFAIGAIAGMATFTEYLSTDGVGGAAGLVLLLACWASLVGGAIHAQRIKAHLAMLPSYGGLFASMLYVAERVSQVD